MLIDTHSHFDCEAFDADREALAAEARAAGVACGLLCAGFPGGFERTRRVARALGWGYALGIHPLYVPGGGPEEALESVRAALEAAAGDPLLCAAGEIGLDAWQGAPPMERQLPVFRAQLRLARDLGLPVSVHARRAVDAVSAEIARLRPPGGVVHAFNGSVEQARRLIGLGMKLGYGGAMLYAGSRRIRAVFSQLPEDAWVLETDAPDMPSPARRAAADSRARPSDIALYAREAALLRGASPEGIARQNAANARAAFPRLAALADSA